jgi:hypothetical protein
MAKEIPSITNSCCQGCEYTHLRLKEFHSEGKAGHGDKHVEIYLCPDCNIQGAVEFTPPTDTYTVKGPLFGEPEDVTSIIEQARQL